LIQHLVRGGHRDLLLHRLWRVEVEFDHHAPGGDLITRSDMHRAYQARSRRSQRVFHFHRFERRKRCAAIHPLSDLDRNIDHSSVHRRGNRPGGRRVIRAPCGLQTQVFEFDVYPVELHPDPSVRAREKERNTATIDTRRVPHACDKRLPCLDTHCALAQDRCVEHTTALDAST
jgi:hypothetical protein